jgi:hypothetical protein
MWKVYHGATVDFFCTTSVEEANGAFHFYTTSAAERDNAVASYGYKYEGIAAYVWPYAI